MTCEFVSNSHCQRLIVIFAGWSTDPSFYSHIHIRGWDTLVVSGYSDLQFPDEILKDYDTIALFAWSLGVFAAAQCFPFDKASLAVAINGTEQPIDDNCGIPEKIFHATAHTLNDDNLRKFRRRMAGGAFKELADKFPKIPIETLREELNFIAHTANGKMVVPAKSRWNKVYISCNDLIFPSKSQHKAWAAHVSKPQIVEVNAPHYVDLLPIIQASIPLHDTVGKRFRKALATYNDSATPQKRIAQHLVRIMARENNNIHGLKFSNILEIGPGSGFLTRCFAEKFNPDTIDFVELYPQAPFGVASSETYHVADAEKWVADAVGEKDGRYDAIISASVMQWFVNPQNFMKNAARLLKPGGVLLCSTFLPGNLEELEVVNPFGLVYHSAEELRSFAGSHFSSVTMEEETIIIDFDNPREILEHLIKTGVGGTAKSNLPIRQLISSLPLQLTYRPLYILARKQ